MDYFYDGKNRDEVVDIMAKYAGGDRATADKIYSFYIDKQIIACQEERQNAINCPYCDQQNIEGNPLCCELLARAVAASDPLKVVELMSLHFDESVRALLTAGMS